MRLKAIAKLEATVDLPTPPLPEATIRIYFILDVPKPDIFSLLSLLNCSSGSEEAFVFSL